MNTGFSNIFENCIENVSATEKQIEDHCFETSRNDSFDRQLFWKEIDIHAKNLSVECTKVCISFSSSPFPSATETSGLLQCVERRVAELTRTATKFDGAREGRAVTAALVRGCLESVRAAKRLLEAIRDEGGGAAERFRRATGVAWEGCRSLEECPKHNRDAVAAKLAVCRSLVTDALEEITEMLEGDGRGWDCLGSFSDEDESDDENHSWSDKDKSLIEPSIQIIKAAKALFGKLPSALADRGQMGTGEAIAELDLLADDAERIPQLVDALILELYPPLDVSNMETMTQSLACDLIALSKSVASLSFVVGPDEVSGLEFLRRAVEHNLNKMKQMLRST